MFQQYICMQQFVRMFNTYQLESQVANTGKWLHLIAAPDQMINDSIVACSV